jgi:hypothetical protein
MEGSILGLLEEHGSLGYEQIAALLRKPPDAVRTALLACAAAGSSMSSTLGTYKVRRRVPLLTGD